MNVNDCDEFFLHRKNNFSERMFFMEKNLRFPGFRTKAFTMSYDDDTRHDITFTEILNKYGLKCTFNLNGNNFATEPGSKMMTKQEAIHLLKDSPHEVALHSYSHPQLEQLSDTEIVYNILKDREILEEMFGTIITGMAYPFGSYDQRVLNILHLLGVKYSRTTRATHNFALPLSEQWLTMPATCHHSDPELMNLAEKFLAPDNLKQPWAVAPRLFYVWGHAYEFDTDQNWDLLETFCQKIGGRDDVWYATNMEIYRYVEAFRHLECSVDSKIVYNPSDIEVFFTIKDNHTELGSSHRVGPGETIYLDI